MRKNAMNLKRRWIRSGLILLILAISLPFASSCTKYNPALYPSYDVLNPNESVRKNPLAVAEVTPEGEIKIHKDSSFLPGKYFIVDQAFMMWVYELKQEILKIRKLIK